MKIAVVLLAGLLAFGATGFGRQEPDPSPLIHGLASFALPGLGQYLNAEYDKAYTHFAVGVGIVLVGNILFPVLVPPRYRGLWTLPYFFWALYSGWDAYTGAMRREGITLRLSPGGFTINF